MHAHRLQCMQVQFKERMFLERGRNGAHYCIIPHQCKQHSFWHGRVWGAVQQAPWALECSQPTNLSRRSHINLHDTWYMGWSTNCLSWNSNGNKEHAIPGGILLPRLAFDLYNISGQSAGILRNQITHCVFLSFSPAPHFSHLLENVIKIQVVSLDLYQRLQTPLISSACDICARLPHLIVWLSLAVRVEKLTIALLFKETPIIFQPVFHIKYVISSPHLVTQVTTSGTDKFCMCLWDKQKKKKRKEKLW